MNFTVRTLTLHRALVLSEQAATDGTIRLYEYRCLVKPKDLEPKPADHLAEGKPARSIPAGLYLFTQGELPDEAGALEDEVLSSSAEALFRDAAEALWLEALWRELTLKNERILVRILSEDSKNIFQLFREV
jgi:hypothetical protein